MSVLSNYQPMHVAITRDPDVMHGTPVFRGARVPAQTLFDSLENGESLDEVPATLPYRQPGTGDPGLAEAEELRLALVQRNFPR